MLSQTDLRNHLAQLPFTQKGNSSIGVSVFVKSYSKEEPGKMPRCVILVPGWHY